MSIEHRRLAARQWTAANVRDDALDLGLRKKRLASWILIIPTLAVFSLMIVAGARAIRKPDYAAAIRQLPKNRPLIVVAGAEKSLDVVGWFKGQHENKMVCSVTRSQLAFIASRYNVGHVTMTVDGRTVDMVTVSNASEIELRRLLGGPQLDCKLVRIASVFFLPFDAHGS